MKKMVILAFIAILCVGILHNGTVEAKKQKTTVKIEMLPWTEVNHIIPKYTKFIVVDLETGEEFHVQRRAGSQHADVQPLTTSDTKIMKNIYNGKWSWKRRAIIVKYNDKRIAASMHGMPHGGGALKNNFPGHFCIHFYGSKTHRKNHMDLSHKLMVLKAAGELEKHLQSADPYEVTSSFVAGFKEQDQFILSLLSLQKFNWKNILPSVENVSLGRMSELPVEDLEGELTLTVPVEIVWFLKNRGRSTFDGNVQLYRFSPGDAWKVDAKSFLEDNRLIKK